MRGRGEGLAGLRYRGYEGLVARGFPPEPFFRGVGEVPKQ